MTNEPITVTLDAGDALLVGQALRHADTAIERELATVNGMLALYDGTDVDVEVLAAYGRYLRQARETARRVRERLDDAHDA